MIDGVAEAVAVVVAEAVGVLLELCDRSDCNNKFMFDRYRECGKFNSTSG